MLNVATYMDTFEINSTKIGLSFGPASGGILLGSKNRRKERPILMLLVSRL